VFAECAKLRHGAVAGRIVLDGQQLPQLPPGSEVREAGLDQDRHADWVALWSQHDNAYLAGPSLAHIDSSGRVCLEAVYGPHAWADPVWRRKKPLPVRELAGDYTSVVSRWNDGKNYYHWFLDGLTRLLYLPDFPPDCKILIPRDLPHFARQSLEILGLTGRVVETGNEDLMIERFWFAGPTMLSGCPDPAGIGWLKSHFLPTPPVERHRRLYLDRNAPTRNLTNVREVRHLFMERGWEILDPAEMALADQIRIFREARVIAGTHGAAFTNLLWASPGTRILEFLPSRRRNGCYAGIAWVAGLPHQSLVCPSDRAGNMKVPVAQLTTLLKALEMHFE
jgi:capsular polysaccharide biosynthesis protein